ARGATRRAASRHHHDLSATYRPPFAVRGSGRAGHHGTREFHRVASARCYPRTRTSGAAHAIAVSHWHWGGDRTRRRLSGLHAAAGARESGVATQAPDYPRRNGRDLSGAADVARRGKAKGRPVERPETRSLI